MTWSYSRISGFEMCPYKWFLTYIRGDEEAPTFYASYGSFIHSLLERFYKGELTEDALPSEFLLHFSEEVKGERPSPEIVSKYIQAGLSYLKSFRPFQFETVAVEKELQFDLDGAPFLAIADYIGRKDGKLVIVDNKSRELKPRSGRKKPTQKDQELDGMLRQLYLYAHGVKQEYGELPSLLCFNCFKNGAFIEEPFVNAAYEDTLEWAKREIEFIAGEEDFRPSADYFRCRWLCGFHDDCCYYGRR